jgi:hypothetical protein
MENFIIHIFNYGETQLISKEHSVKVKTDLVSGETTTLINTIWNLKPSGTTGNKEFHVIHVFGYDDVRWLGGNKTHFTLKNNTTLKPLIDNLITELVNLEE